MNISILPPDINESEREFKIDGSSVRFGLEAVKGVGGAAIEIILEERQKGAFQAFDNFLTRIDSKKVNKKVVESLIKAGAFDSLYRKAQQSPGGVCKSISSGHMRALAMEAFASQGKSADKGPGLFGDMEPAAQSVQPWDEKILLGYEKEALGFYISGHPMARYRKTLSRMNVSPISAISDMQEPSEPVANGKGYLDERADITVAGIIKTRAKEKSITAYITIEDETSSAEALAFSDLYRKNAEILKKGAVVMIKGQLTKADKGAKLIAREVEDISAMEIALKYEVSLNGDQRDVSDKMRSIRGLLAAPANGKGSGTFELKLNMKYFSIIIVSQFQPCGNFAVEVERLTGEKVRVT
jgi:DNA polymerase-3 subunit alpha